jgi:Family of unknown function (DUF6064)
MSEWWTYTLADFLLFSPRTYYRLVARYNDAVWPGQLLALGLGIFIAVLVLRPVPQRGRIVAALLAAAWAWVAWAFLWRRFGTINWAATYFAWLFALEAALLLWSGVLRGRLGFRARGDRSGTLGLGVYLLAALAFPLWSPMAGHGWEQAEVFGIMPDPTAVATLALVAGTDRRWGLGVVPVLWCLISVAMHWAMRAGGGP